MPRDIVTQLQALRHERLNPDPVWLKANRALLLAQIKNTVAVDDTRAPDGWENIWSRLSIFLPRQVVYNVVRPLAVLTVAILVGTSGWIASVDAAYDALPGDGVAYYLKRSFEKTQVAVVSLIGDQTARTKVHLKLAVSRASEVKKILARHSASEEEKQNNVSATVADFKQEINAVNKNIDASGSAAQTLKEVATDVKQIKAVLQDAKNALPASSTPELAEELKSAKDLAKDVSVKAVEGLVNKHLAGDQSVSTAEITLVVSSTLQSVANDATDSKQNATVVKNIVDAAQAAASASTTKNLADKISATVSQSAVVAAQATQVSADVDKQVSAAKSALALGDLTQAVGTIKDVAQVNKTVEQLTDSVAQQAQAVFPAGEAVKDLTGPPAESSLSVVSSTITATNSSSTVKIVTTTKN